MVSSSAACLASRSPSRLLGKSGQLDKSVVHHPIARKSACVVHLHQHANSMMAYHQNRRTDRSDRLIVESDQLLSSRKWFLTSRSSTDCTSPMQYLWPIVAATATPGPAVHTLPYIPRYLRRVNSPTTL